MALGLGSPVENRELDEFMTREGYETRTRQYLPVAQCWCGSRDFSPAHNRFSFFSSLSPLFKHYQLCDQCGCLLLKFVIDPQYMGELYGPRYFREHQAAIGLPTFQQRYELDAKDRVPLWIRVLKEFRDKGSVLEIGCSHGRFLKEIADLGYRIVGLELDPEIAAWTKEKTGQDIRSQRLETMENETFDAVFASDVIEHVYDPIEFIAASARVLNPGGRAFFQTVVFDRWQDCPVQMLRPVYHTILYQRSSLERLASKGVAILPTIKGVYGCDMVVAERVP